jgi:ligand-binding SRPBCC domain-containing protein
MYPGQVLTYKMKPLPGIPLFWMTEVRHVQDRKFFVDEQREGPYSLWQHQHHFREITGGVEMTGLVHYQFPLGIFGNLANSLFIKISWMGSFRSGIRMERISLVSG